MSRVKCSKCGRLAHSVVEGKAYCSDCIPKPTMPVSIEETVVNEMVIEKMERPKPWPAPEPLGDGYFKVPQQKPEKKSWWETFLGCFANPFKN